MTLTVLWIASASCGACVDFIETWEEMKEEMKSIVFEKLFIEDDEYIEEKYNIKFLPTFLFFEDKRMYDTRVVGANEEQLRKRIEYLTQG